MGTKTYFLRTGRGRSNQAHEAGGPQVKKATSMIEVEGS